MRHAAFEDRKLLAATTRQVAFWRNYLADAFERARVRPNRRNELNISKVPQAPFQN